jgi:hypothetical protein
MARIRLSAGYLVVGPVLLLLALAPRLLGSAAEAVPIFPAGSPPEKLDAAAAALETASREGGGGYRFEIVQTQTLVAKPGGPRIDIPDPADRSGSLGVVDELVVAQHLERGIVTPAGFWSEIREGPGGEIEPDFASGFRFFSALLKNGTSWRDDGRGWYEATALPGIGLDPATAALLPAFLRSAAEPTVTGTGSDGGRAIETLAATGRVADIPGVVAADGLAFTEITQPVEISLDNAGRPARLVVIARNTNSDVYDLIVRTEIRLFYGGVGSLPEPEPPYAPPTPTPAPSFDWPPGFTPPPLPAHD